MRKAYPSDLTDEQWEVIRPLIPPAKPGGRPRKVDMREVLNTLFYQGRSGCQWDMLPHDLLPKSSVWDYFAEWRDNGTWQQIVDALRGKVRTACGRAETPSVGCIDSQSVKTTEMGGERGCDGGKRVNGRKRHILVASLGLLLAVLVTAANVDDGVAAPRVLGQLDRKRYPRLKVIFGDGRYHSYVLQAWMERERVPYTVEVVQRPPGERTFKPLKIRWVVEQVFACLGRYRRLSKDYERTTSSSEAWIRACSVNRMLRRLKPNKKTRDLSSNIRGLSPNIVAIK